MSRIVRFTAALVIVLALAAPAFASGGSTGREFGAHHSEHAIEMTGYTADMNPGGMHRGFSGWGK